MTEYQDEAGSYSGELLNGVPHGQGFKIYTPDLYFEGNWEFGYKSGIGFYNYHGEGYCFGFSKGKISQIYYENIRNFETFIQLISFLSRIKTVKVGETYHEQINENQIELEDFGHSKEMTKFEFIKFIGEKVFGIDVQANQNEEFGKNFHLPETFESNTFFQISDLKYEGESINQIPEGLGKVFLKNELIYEGEFHEGKKWGNGKEYENGKLIYEGQFINDEYNGNGSLYLPNGDLILSEFKDGKTFGNAILISENFKYEGELLDLMPNGQGKLECPNYVYTGEFKNGMMNGFGVKEMADYKIEGNFVNNKYSKVMTHKNDFFEYKGEINDEGIPNGKGVIKSSYIISVGQFMRFELINGITYHMCSNGVTLEQIKKNTKCEKHFIISFDGHKYYYKIGDRPIALNDCENWKLFEEKHFLRNKRYPRVEIEGGVFYGDFLNEKLDGKGKIEFENGDNYEGSFSHSMINGAGVYRYSDGTVFTGYFKDGLKDGPGKMEYKDKTIIKGTWKSDQLEGFSRIFKSGMRIQAFWQQGKLLRQLKCSQEGENFFGELVNL